ncbi:oxygen-independent coproporphyrinogen III oxidase [Jannaschia sp. S6380]|uniref:oxygen-independent coproporphyrinogen III oxidase n=1 Tax=Jannaschia sp. S6380 TaxID=2926408 RepID=UPI001FF45D2B|nr:oxygen-independent coproporphyrinogen III oxidase [Jannaschia sp. S6380]MCK0167710.1 oxygen-independent coproporphyrinogen III oxidase [Jannaschia sp. S6380]
MTDHAFLSRHGLFQARAPRYTSYPTAPHFDRAVGPAQMEGWLASLPEGAGISLYVHVPFCRRLCWFCACRTQGTKTDAPLRPWLDALRAEIDLMADAMPQVRIDRLHLGGGTPTILPPEMLDEMAEALRARFAFAPGAEISVEIDPTVIDDPRLDALARLGVTRASIGVQDFAPKVQHAIGRTQSVAQTREAVEGLRARGVSGLNLDLLYGLPFQDANSLGRTVDQALTLFPDRIALFGYAHVPWVARRQVMIPADALPNAETRMALFAQASDRLTGAGFASVGIDHFARPADGLCVAQDEGRLRRNFQGYTDDDCETLIGLGPSAISRLPQGYAQNDPGTAKWQAAVRARRPATLRGHALSTRDRLEAVAIEELLCRFGAEAEVVAARAGADPAEARALLAGVAADWPEAVRPTARGIRIVGRARPLARLIAMSIDGYERGDRHSLAV